MGFCSDFFDNKPLFRNSAIRFLSVFSVRPYFLATLSLTAGWSTTLGLFLIILKSFLREV